MVEPLRHRQTKGAATDMFYLMPPRHISTLRKADKTVVASIRLAGGCEGSHDLVDAVRVVHRLTVYLACVFRKTLPKCRDRYAPIVKAPATSARQEGFGPITTGYIEST